MSDPQSAPMGEQELIALAEELREYTAMKYAGDCKCGKCQLVPRALVDRLHSALRAAASPRLAGSREEIAVLQAISDGYTGKIEHGYLVVENPDATPQSIALGGVDPNLAVSAESILTLLGPAPSESVGRDKASIIKLMREYADAFEATIPSQPSTKLKHRAEGMAHGVRIVASKLSSQDRAADENAGGKS